MSTTAALHRASCSFRLSVGTARLRSEGVLSAGDVARCRDMGIALAYDPVQIGWVPLACEDDIAAGTDGKQERGLRFRPWSVEDAPALARMLSCKRLWDYLPEDCPGRIDERTARDLIELGSAPHHHVVAVIEGDEPIGQARLLFWKPGEAEISYWLGVEYWGRGLGSEIVRRFTKEGFRDRPDIERIFARVHEDNAASRRVLEKASFAPAGKEGAWEVFEQRR